MSNASSTLSRCAEPNEGTGEGPSRETRDALESLFRARPDNLPEFDPDPLFDSADGDDESLEADESRELLDLRDEGMSVTEVSACSLSICAIASAQRVFATRQIWPNEPVLAIACVMLTAFTTSTASPTVTVAAMVRSHASLSPIVIRAQLLLTPGRLRTVP